MNQYKDTPSPADKLRALLAKPEMMVISACYDALTARLIEQAGMPATFMSGFGVAATRLALPDTGLISYGEMVEQGRNICGTVDIPVLGDGDTGFGNPINIKRTVRGNQQAGFACVMIKDQEMPKRCGHTAGKTVVNRDEALLRIRAAVDARKEGTAMQQALTKLKRGEPVPDLMDFNALQNIVGFAAYDSELAGYRR